MNFDSVHAGGDGGRGLGTRLTTAHQLGISSFAESPMATSSRTPSRFLEGPMFKRGRVAKGWKYRWFVLDRHVGLLSYYTVSINSADR